MRFFLLLYLFLFLSSYEIDAETKAKLSVLKSGDILFQETRSEQAKAIQLVTHSRYTHVGIVLDRGNGLEVLEAVQPVRWISLERFIAKGKGGHFAAKRLKDRTLTPEELQKIEKAGAKWVGKNYDPFFEWSDDRIYCTELIWKLYERVAGIEIGELKTLGDYDLSHPYVKQLMKKRYGNRVPLDEKVISPQGMFESKHLAPVPGIE